MDEKFSGYKVVIGVIIYMFFAFGLMNVTSVAFATFPEYFHASMTEVSFGVTIYSIVNCILLMFTGEYLNKVGPRRAMIVGTLAVLIFCLIIAFVPSIWGFYIAQIVIAIPGSTCMHVCATMIISNWFVEKQSKLIGMCIAAGYFGTAFCQLVAGRAFVSIGVSKLYLYFGMAEAIILLFVTIFLIRNKPQDVGQKPLGWKDKPKDSIEQQAKFVPIKSIYKNPVFWTMAISFFFSLLCLAAITTYTTTLMPMYGFSLDTASTVVSLLGLAGGFITFFIGFALERFGLKKLICIIIISAMVSNIAMYLWTGAPSTVLLVVMGITYALGYPIGTISNIVAGPVFGNQAYLANPKLTAASYIGYATLLPVLTYVATNNGFAVTYIIGLGACLVVMISFLISLKIVEKKSGYISEIKK